VKNFKGYSSASVDFPQQENSDTGPKIQVGHDSCRNLLIQNYQKSNQSVIHV